MNCDKCGKKDLNENQLVPYKELMFCVDCYNTEVLELNERDRTYKNLNRTGG